MNSHQKDKGQMNHDKSKLSSKTSTVFQQMIFLTWRVGNNSKKPSSSIILENSTVAIPIGNKNLSRGSYGYVSGLTQVFCIGTRFKSVSKCQGGLKFTRFKLEIEIRICYIQSIYTISYYRSFSKKKGIMSKNLLFSRQGEGKVRIANSYSSRIS